MYHMDIKIAIFFVSIIIFLPLTGILLYVWNKYGKGEKKVMAARIIFLLGSLALFGYMLTL